jgi:hypothetical protein
MPKPKGKRNANRLVVQSPKPLVFVPPSDPPTISASKARTVDIVFQQSTNGAAGGGFFDFTPLELEAQIKKQYYASTTATFYYQILQVMAYAAASASGSFAMLDVATGVTSFDTGTYASRAKMGIKYPPTAQHVIASPTSVTEFIKITGSIDTPVEVYTKVRFWDKPDLSVAAPPTMEPLPVHTVKKGRDGH